MFKHNTNISVVYCRVKDPPTENWKVFLNLKNMTYSEEYRLNELPLCYEEKFVDLKIFLLAI